MTWGEASSFSFTPTGTLGTLGHSSPDGNMYVHACTRTREHTHTHTHLGTKHRVQAALDIGLICLLCTSPALKALVSQFLAISRPFGKVLHRLLGSSVRLIRKAQLAKSPTGMAVSW